MVISFYPNFGWGFLFLGPDNSAKKSSKTTICFGAFNNMTYVKSIL